MILGHKPSGYVVTFDKNGNKIEQETRQCIHCQKTWIYQPGSKRKYGFCLKCFGIVCATCAGKDCPGPFQKQIERK